MQLFSFLSCYSLTQHQEFRALFVDQVYYSSNGLCLKLAIQCRDKFLFYTYAVLFVSFHKTNDVKNEGKRERRSVESGKIKKKILKNTCVCVCH